ncbi:MAG: ribonuclease PH [Candidatus Margulisbacteria bacterium]|nr:ribonuclease PH [Candidatus Margulisiibacteriota bacterium]
MARINNRQNNELRSLKITPGFNEFAEGSALIELGNTKVICTASIEEKVPPFLRDKGEGWVTAEYAMIPRATTERCQRDRFKVSGRTYEIQRLVGRSLRAIVDMKKLGERTITIDTDVIQADGGTRTASITGAYVALVQAIRKLQKNGVLQESPIATEVAAVSVGVVDGQPLLDLAYEEDSKAEVDMNIVMTGSGKFIEIQGTAEKEPFDDQQMSKLISLARNGIEKLIAEQRRALK